MISPAFKNLLTGELARLDGIGSCKRREKIISGFTPPPSSRAVISGREFLVFNSNDYLGLRRHPALIQAEHDTCKKFGTGPGAVRFISGSLQIYHDLEQALAGFHRREAAMLFSSGFAANLAVISSLIKSPSKNSLIGPDVLVLSDELNHRSIVDGIRLANLDESRRQIFPHFDLTALAALLEKNAGKFPRALILTDGIFSMLGQYQDLAKMGEIVSRCGHLYPQGIILYVDDCHGIGSVGKTGRGVEEICRTSADVLVGTLGKALGTDGGYVVGDQVLIDYLRESAATYIYSNPVSPGTAGAALKSVQLVDGPEGEKLLSALAANVSYFKQQASRAGLKFAADSLHPVQPLLIGDTAKTLSLADKLFSAGILVTPLSYPVVPAGRDEIRIQLSASHTREDIDTLIREIS